MIKFRPVRGRLEESMKEVHELPATRVALAAHLQKQYEHRVISSHTIEVTPYRYDERINWNTHLVTVLGEAMGYTDGPLES
jgi:hypothetical protein